MRSISTSWYWAAAFAVGAATTVVAVGCADDRAPLLASGSSSGSSGSADACILHDTGCPCAKDGAVVACGSVKRISGDYISCSTGTRVCKGGAWGECSGDVTTKEVKVPLYARALGAQSPCVGNPCDPSCQNMIDDGSDLGDAGAGIKASDAGLTLEGIVSDASVACTALTVSPASPVAFPVTAMGGPNTLQLTPALLPSGCYVGPVPALWTVDQFDIAQIGSTGLMTLVTPIAGDIVVNAYAGTLSAPPTTVRVTVAATDTSAAPPAYASPTFFTGAGAADNIEILYPYAGTVFPLGQIAPLIQWRDGGSAADAVRVSLRYPATGTAIFNWSEIIYEKTTVPATAIAAQPRAVLPQSAWFAFEQTVARNRTASGDTGIFAIQRIVGGALRTETTRTVRFADGQLKGRIYYNSYGTNLVQNYGNTYGGARFGAATLMIPPGASTPSVVAGSNSASNGPGCRVCHSVSPNGNVLATLQDNYTAVSYDLTAPLLSEVVIGSSGKYTWPALSPDGSYMFSDASSLPGSGGSKSVLYYTSLGVPMLPPATIFTNLKAGTPAFRGDGAQLAFNFFGGGAAPLSNPTSGPTSGDQKTLSMMDFDPVLKQFSSFRNLYTPTSGAAMWPSFLPPGQNGVVFEREIIRSRNGGWGFTRSNCDSRDGACNTTGATGELWWVNTTGTPQAVALANANGVGLPTGPNLHGSGTYSGDDGGGHAVNTTNFNDPVYNYEPTVLPIQSGGYSWVVFTSRRMYGNVSTINPYYSDPRFRDISKEPTPKKLWVAAISNNPAAGTDPSFPAFYLPGQELLAGNSRAYFALEACRSPGAPTAANLCDTDLDCCGGAGPIKTAICKLDQPLANPPLRHCVSNSSATCSLDGSTCGSDAACCNFSSGSRCASGTCTAPPPLVNYGAAVFVREYAATCPFGQRPLWRFFDWQSNTPAGTSIVFTAATRETASDPYGTEVGAGTAAPYPVVTPTWTSGSSTVDEALRASGQLSKPLLRVTATLLPKNSTPTAAPTLTQWRQSFSCVDAE
jgi:hypothetical protein